MSLTRGTVHFQSKSVKRFFRPQYNPTINLQSCTSGYAVQPCRLATARVHGFFTSHQKPSRRPQHQNLSKFPYCLNYRLRAFWGILRAIDLAFFLYVLIDMNLRSYRLGVICRSAYRSTPSPTRYSGRDPSTLRRQDWLLR